MKRGIALAAVALSIVWCGVSIAALAPEVQEAIDLATGKLPLTFQPRSATSGNSVVIESKSILPGDTATIGIYITNDVPIRCFVLPFIIRSVDPGAYITHLEGVYNGGSRLNGYLDGVYHDTTYFTPIINTYSTYSTERHYLVQPPVAPDYVSPDGIFFVRSRILPENNLPVGSDGEPGAGTPMIMLKVQANSVPGRFEIDTCAVAWDNHVMFIHGAGVSEPLNNTAILPEFTKGRIKIITTATDGTLTDATDTTDPVVIVPPEDTIVTNPPEDTVVILVPKDSVATGDSTVVVINAPTDTSPYLDTTYISIPSSDSSHAGSGDYNVGAPGILTGEVAASVSNYPNPFNSATTIRYTLEASSKVTVVVYDLLGRTVSTLVDAYQSPGDYNIPWEGRDAYGRSVPAGIYFYRVQNGGFKSVGKMVLLK